MPCHPHLHPSAGCVRQLRIQGEEVAFGDMDLQAHGVTSCPTCQDRPCQVRMVGVMPTHPHLSPPIADAPVIPPERWRVPGRREWHLRLPLSPRLHRQQLRVLAGFALSPR